MLKDKLKDIIDNHPEALDFFVANGFEQLKNAKMLNTMGKMVTLENALKSKNINADLFIEKLEKYLEERNEFTDRDLVENSSFERGEVSIEGVLPCPIRVPLLEGFENWLEDRKSDFDFTYSYELKSANLGLDWIKEQLKSGDIDKVPEILMSAGFDLFFDDELMGRYIDSFEAVSNEMNSDFANDSTDLRDPEGKYLITGVVPAVMLVNKNELGDRKMPEKWEDILKPEFENSVAIPMQDLDLFNAFLIHIYEGFGIEGIKAMARSFKKNLHPAQMVKSGRTQSEPAVSIIPYFFTQMIKEGSGMEAVWPEDGAIISPIFMMAKKEPAEKIKPFTDFFMSREIGEIFSANGKFPSTNPMVDNHLNEDMKFRWVGWDFIHKNNIGKLLGELEDIFKKEVDNAYSDINREIQKKNESKFRINL